MRVVLCNESQQRSSRVATREKILRLSFNVFYELRIPRTIQSVHIRAPRRTSFTLAGLYPTDSFTIIFDYVEKRMHKRGRCIRAREWVKNRARYQRARILERTRTLQARILARTLEWASVRNARAYAEPDGASMKQESMRHALVRPRS